MSEMGSSSVDQLVTGRDRGVTEAGGRVATLTRGDFVSDQEVRW